MNNIPAPDPNTVSVYLGEAVDRTGLKVTEVSVNAEGALVWIDPIGHIQIGEHVLAKLVHEHAQREARDSDQHIDHQARA